MRSRLVAARLRRGRRCRCEELADRLSVVDRPRSRAIERFGVADDERQPRPLPRRPRARGGEAPERRPAAADAGRRRRGRAALDRLRRVELRRRRDRRGRAPGRRAAERAHARARKVRGEVSDGMILAEDEVELGTDHAGIMLLDDGPSPARRSPTSCRSPTRCSTSSRPATGPTCSPSTASPARSRRSTTCPSRRCPGVGPGAVPDESRSTIEIEDFEGCPRYIGRLFRDVHDRAVAALAEGAAARRGHAPDLERRRRDELRDARARQPAARVRLRRRCAEGGSSSAARGRARGCARSTAPSARSSRDDLLIADAERAIALAGIMGGEETEIGEETTDVLLEAANFEPHAIFRTSERLRMRTEGSNRWEKGVDPHLAEPAADLATQLIARAGRRELGGARRRARRPARAAGDPLPARARRRADRRRDAAGRPARAARAARLRASDGDACVVPTWRARDVTREVDVVEEVARFRLDDVPFTLPRRRAMFGRSDARAAAPAARRGRARRARLRRDLHAVARGRTTRPDGSRCPSRSRSSYARPADVAPRRASSRPRGATSTRARRGSRCSRSRASTCRPASRCPTSACASPAIVEGGFCRAKGAVEALYAALKAEPRSSRATHPLLHPGKTARDGRRVVGELHPRLLDGSWGAFELDLAPLFAASREPVDYEDVITYPAVRQDLAFIVAEDVAAGDLVAAAREAAGPELREMRASTSTAASRSAPGRKSVAFSVVVPVARAHALGRGRGGLRTRDRRGARRALRRRAARLKTDSGDRGYCVFDVALWGCSSSLVLRRRPRRAGGCRQPDAASAGGGERRLRHHAYR